MEITITDRTFWGWDWPLLVAVVASLSTAASALLTYKLWSTAKHELSAVLEAARANLGAQKAQTMAAHQQLAEATQARQDALLPVVMLSLASKEQIFPRRVWPAVEGGSLWLGGYHLQPQAENVGPGPALEVIIRGWFLNGFPVVPSDMEPDWQHVGPEHFLARIPVLASGQSLRGFAWLENGDTSPNTDIGCFLWRAEASSVYGAAPARWGRHDLDPFDGWGRIEGPARA